MWKCGEAEDNREAAVVIVTATTFQVTERSFPLSRLCARWEPSIPARRNRHTYIYRLIVVYVQLRRIHNHPSQLGEYTISRRGGVPAHRYSSCKLWIWRRRGLPSATLAASTCLESRRDFNLS